MPSSKKTTGRTKRRRRKTMPFHIIIPSAVSAVLVVIFLVCFISSINKLSDTMSQFSQNFSATGNQNGLMLDPNAEQYKGSYVVEDHGSSIAIPGFDTLKLKADSIEQTPGFFNPESNSCYFVIELRLSDGTTIYKSGLLAPGKAIYNTQLTKTLPAGTYPASVIYSCYALNGLEEQNGAEVKITLEVS